MGGEETGMDGWSLYGNRMGRLSHWAYQRLGLGAP